MRLIFIISTLICLSCTREVNVEKPVTTEKDSVISYAPISITDEEYTSGKDVFIKFCRCCHDFEHDYAGPALVYRDDYEFVFHQRRPDYSFWYIMNSDSLFKAGDSWARKMKSDYPSNVMPAFKDVLTKKEIQDVVKFINYRSTNKPCIH